MKIYFLCEEVLKKKMDPLICKAILDLDAFFEKGVQPRFIIAGGYALYLWQQMHAPHLENVQPFAHRFSDIDLFCTKENPRCCSYQYLEGFEITKPGDSSSSSNLCKSVIKLWSTTCGVTFDIIDATQTQSIGTMLDDFDLDVCRIGFSLVPHENDNRIQHNKRECLLVFGLCMKRCGMSRDLRALLIKNVCRQTDCWANMIVPVWHYGKTWNRAAAIDPSSNRVMLDWRKSASFASAIHRKKKYTKRGYTDIVETDGLLEIAHQLNEDTIAFKAAYNAHMHYRHQREAKKAEKQKKKRELIQKDTVERIERLRKERRNAF